MSILDKIFKRKEKPSTASRSISTRSFAGARNSRYTAWLNSSFEKINADINAGLINLIARTRELAKNSTLVRAYLELCEKNIIGKAGFTLQCQLKNADGTLNEAANNSIEWAFWEFGKLSDGTLTLDGGMRTQ